MNFYNYYIIINIRLLGCIRLTEEDSFLYYIFSSRFGLPVDKIRYFPPLGLGITQKGVGEYFEDYPTFVYKADVGGFQEKKSVYITTWVKTAFVTQCSLIKC